MNELVLRGCNVERTLNSRTVNELVNMGAEFADISFGDGDGWVSSFDDSLYRYDRDETEYIECLPRLMVESMQSIEEFAEGKVGKLILLYRMLMSESSMWLYLSRNGHTVEVPVKCG